ncbi:hypothetical protein ACWEWG_40860 [Streptomyces sp. NPDC003758]
MRLTPQQRINKLDRWKNPPSPAEEARLARARRMVTNAVKQHPPFAGLGPIVEPKGSWANNTNVSSDSDMDIKVEFTQRIFRGSTTGMTYWELILQNGAYKGPWTPEKFRSELRIALRRASNAVDASHKSLSTFRASRAAAQTPMWCRTSPTSTSPPSATLTAARSCSLKMASTS